MTSKSLPRGIRNNNPGNIEHRDPWQGLVPDSERTDKRFAEFTSAVWGIRAIARLLINYKDLYKINTLQEAINRWAPPVENNTNAYVNIVSKAAGISPNNFIDLADYHSVKPVIEAIIKHENGPGPLKTPSTWYTDTEIDEALRLAGVKPQASEVAKVPVTKETIAATSVATIGVAQLAEVVPQITDALDKAESNLSSGSFVRIILGVLTIVFAIFIAYSQVKKHQKDLL